MSGKMIPSRTTDGLANVVAGIGTERDKTSYSRYSHTFGLQSQELESMYRSSWLSKRIVNTVSEDMTREWRDFMFDDTDESRQFGIEQEEARLDIQSKVTDALRWARLYGGAALVMGVNGEDLTRPLNLNTVKRGSLKWVRAVDRHLLSGIGQPTFDPESPNFGMPEFYMLGSMVETAPRIHWTRVIRFDGERLPWRLFLENGYWHDSVLQSTYTAIRNSDTASAAISTMLLEANVDVITAEGLNSKLATECGENDVIKRYQLAGLMKSVNRMLILDGMEKYEKKTNNFSNLDKIWERSFIEVAGACGIPMVILFAQSASGLNATGDNDVRNYYDMVSAKQESDLRGALVRLDEVLVRSALGTMPENYRFTFRSLWQMSDKERAEIDKARAERDNIYLSAGVVSEGIVARDLLEKGTYSSMTEEDVEAAEELDKPMDTEEE